MINNSEANKRRFYKRVRQCPCVGRARSCIACPFQRFSPSFIHLPTEISHPSTRSRLNCLLMSLPLHAASTFSINSYPLKLTAVLLFMGHEPSCQYV